ncbi:mycofactocin system GMC family oxidoreductase MftG [Rhodococcus spelaei]|uniref:Mycofactocin system GMC family oxidoreductase MftG n=1 Tax=Rhodococcus spelaei TaxID=2546320 RepID=A0A541B8V9_9NOCA|nr:mycofactocin system GMC family oxidoreductase MftG [Rhodococcus spelaei]TQF68759.1 mycofactocin system GMC family oxidoreductase MftG [Rhodococcus spelaei]
MPAAEPVADVVVVGAGSGGCVVAARLSENPDRTVVLVEAGSDGARTGPIGTLPVGPGSPLVWRYPGELQPGRDVVIARGRTVGGSGAVNGGYFVRGTAADFERWPATWSYAAVLPYFRKLETDPFGDRRWHGDGGPMPIARTTDAALHSISAAFLDAAASAGFGYRADLNEPDATGAGPVPLNAHRGTRVSTAAAYLGPAADRANLRVRTGAVARRVVFEAGRAVGVEVDLAGERRVLRARTVVLCAGAVGTPQLLMHSGIGPAQQLSRLGLSVLVDRPGVGQGFEDHPEVTVGYRRAVPSPHARGRAILEVVLEADGIELRPYTASFGDIIPGVGDSVARIGVALMRPESRGEVVLRSADPADPPLVRYHYLRSAADQAAMRSGLELAQDLLSSSPFARLVEPVPTGAAVAGMLDNLGTSMHLSGSCRMGADDDPTAVVDDRCRVIGVEGLSVADTSVMPVLTSRGPHATAVMIAERVAAFLDA